MRTLLILILITGSCYAQCGSEKSSQKDLSFADTAFLRLKPIQSTVQGENALPVSAGSRLIEATGTITAYKLEADGDFHAVLTNGSSHMIIELPNPECPEVKKSSRYEGMKASRAWFLSSVGTPSAKMKTCSVSIDLIGVEFFDKKHGQFGMAPKNAVEIHPVLKIKKN